MKKNKNKHYHTQGDTSESLVSLQIAVNPRSGSYQWSNFVTRQTEKTFLKRVIRCLLSSAKFSCEILLKDSAQKFSMHIFGQISLT